LPWCQLPFIGYAMATLENGQDKFSLFEKAKNLDLKVNSGLNSAAALLMPTALREVLRELSALVVELAEGLAAAKGEN
jgi:hypothetical protein